MCVPRAECQPWGQIASPPLSLALDPGSKSFLLDRIFSVTRRSRSDSRPLLSVSTDLTDVTLVSDDTY